MYKTGNGLKTQYTDLKTRLLIAKNNPINSQFDVFHSKTRHKHKKRTFFLASKERNTLPLDKSNKNEKKLQKTGKEKASVRAISKQEQEKIN
jgi:hypothetical protein